MYVSTSTSWVLSRICCLARNIINTDTISLSFFMLVSQCRYICTCKFVTNAGNPINPEHLSPREYNLLRNLLIPAWYKRSSVRFPSSSQSTQLASFLYPGIAAMARVVALGGCDRGRRRGGRFMVS